MSKAEKIARLQALLDRVRSRSGEPRRVGSGTGVPASGARAGAPTGAAVIDAPVATAAYDAGAAGAEPNARTAWTPAPPAGDLAEDAEAESDRESLVDVDIEVDVEITDLPPAAEGALDEAASGGGSESAERLVAAGAEEEIDRAGGELPDAITDAPPPVDYGPGAIGRRERADPEPRASSPFEPEPSTHADRRDELDAPEAAPVSSRRPVEPEQAEPHLADLAFAASDARAAPRHTPPPQSGQLPAPPAEFEEDTGVREAIPAPPASRAPSLLTPVAIRGSLHAAESVADLVAEIQAFAPRTFVEWLDATLSL